MTRPRPTPFPRSHWVYVHIDALANVLYVGCTKDIDARTAAHEANAPWAADIADMGVIGPFMRSTALKIEEEFIRALQPPHNTFYTDRDPRVRSNWPTAVPARMPMQIQTTKVTHYASQFGRTNYRAWCGTLTVAKPEAFESTTPATCRACCRAAALMRRGSVA